MQKRYPGGIKDQEGLKEIDVITKKQFAILH
jgi:hypothetical protein